MPQPECLALMERALSLYDAAGKGTNAAACHLQAAVDAERGARPLRPGEEIDPALLDDMAQRLGTSPD